MSNIRFLALLAMTLHGLLNPAWAAFDSATFNKQRPLEIQRITPSGDDVGTERQIVFQFNQPVVPVGKMERDTKDIPITITPTVTCEWRWLNTSALACQLGEKTALRPATRYQVVIQPGIMTEAKETLKEPVKHTFTTQRPAISYTAFKTWHAPGMPEIRVSFNQPVTRDSVLQHLYLQKPSGQRIAITAKLPPTVDKTQDDTEESEENAGENDAGENDTTEPEKPSEKAKETTPIQVSSPAVIHVSRIWMITPKTLLPLDTTMRLMVEPGVVSDQGEERGIEKRVVVEFNTFPEFKFVGLRCHNLAGEELLITPNDKNFKQKLCNPLNSISLQFTSPVINDVVKKNLVVTPDLAGGRTDYDPWEKTHNQTHLGQPHSKGANYSVWLPELLKAYHIYEIKAEIAEFKDEFGRPLAEPIAMQFMTSHRNPNLVFEHETSVLEKGVDSEVPIYLTNIDKMILDYFVLTPEGWSEAKSKEIRLPEVKDLAVKLPLGIRDLLPGKSGVVQGHYTTIPSVYNRSQSEWFSNWFLSQVTPYHVQVKLGHHNTLVWVTDFATGQPVEGVNVSIYQDNYAVEKPTVAPPVEEKKAEGEQKKEKTASESDESEENEEDTDGRVFKKGMVLAKAVTNANGVAFLPGTDTVDPQLHFVNQYDKREPRLFVRCEKGEDSALISLDYEFFIHMYDLGDSIYANLEKKYGHVRSWGTTAQGIYKVGDTVQFKFFVRDQSNEAFVPAPREGYSLKVIDPTGKIIHEVKELSLSEFGAYDGEFTVPKTGAVGWYQFELSAGFTTEKWQPIRVLVSDFTPAPFRVQTVLSGELFRVDETVQINTAATLHAGGPYADAATKVQAILSQQPLSTDNPQAKGFQFDTHVKDFHDNTVYHTESQVNDQGQLQTSFTFPSELPVLYGRLLVESTVRDDRGKDVANAASARYVGRDRFVGLKPTGWLLNAEKPSQILALVVDEHGNPATGTAIQILIERQETKAARVKGAGNAYLTRFQHEWVETGKCQVTSDKAPSTCTFNPPKSGTYRMTATIKDTKGRPHSTQLQQWAIGKGMVVWETAPGNGLEIVPEQESYKVGETARYLIKNPFPGAKALITVERLGTISHWVKVLENGAEIIEIPILPDYVPGFFVSVTVTSPRVDKPIDKDQVDLGKPAFRLGYVKTMVKDPYKEIMVDIKTDKPVYKPREKVTVNLHAQVRQTNIKVQPLELAVAVLDESVFDLLAQGRDYFDPYKGFYNLENLDMANYSLLMRLIGRQKFEKKGATPGGDGGMGLGLRSVFKFVSYWNPSIKADAEGKAQIQFEVPDNLTGWRVLVMAVTPNDRMGLGDANFKVNQPIEIRPVLPNQITSGDSFEAGFNIMNRTDKIRELTVNLEAKGTIEIPTGKTSQSVTQTLKAEPFKRYTVWLPIKTTKEGIIEFAATAKDAEEKDGLSKTLEIRKRRSLESSATYGTTLENEVTESVSFPKEIHADTGGLKVIASPTVIGGVEGAFKYMRDYPYICWEQKLTKGVMASHFNNLKAYLPEVMKWESSVELPDITLALATEYQAPNGGMTFFNPQDRYVSPYLSAYTALAFNWLRDSGHTIPDAVENKLHEYLLNLLRRDTVPDYYSKGMASTVRAVALAALAKHAKVTLADIRRYQSHVKQMDLFGKALFLSAALQIPGTDKVSTEVVNMILSNADQTSGKISFIEALDDGYKRILASPLRTECAILSSLVLYDESMGKSSTVGDLPFKLVREITQTRKAQGHWENTQENMFCMNALTDFARVYEADKPAMTVRALLDTEKLGETHFSDVKNPPVTFAHDMTENDPGRSAKVKVERQGQGRVYYTVRMTYASKEERAQPINSGIEVNREYHVEREGKWVLLKSPMEVKTGELVRVDLYLSVPAPRHFVVVDDPVPGGLEPVNRDLATTSQIDADKADKPIDDKKKPEYAGGSFWFRFSDWHEYGVSFWTFYHRELRHHAAIFYSDYLPVGNYHLSYVAQVIAPGEFTVMPTHSEEMYEPEVFGKSMPATLKVTRD